MEQFLKKHSKFYNNYNAKIFIINYIPLFFSRKSIVKI